MVRIIIVIVLFSLAYWWLNSHKDSAITKNIDQVNDISLQTINNTGAVIDTINKINKIKENVNNLRP